MSTKKFVRLHRAFPRHPHSPGAPLSADEVWCYPASDGRFRRENRGSDHGWGSHQIVMGGAVQGGNIYGRMPKFVLSGADPQSEDSSTLGRWIPSTSVDQFGATLARWFGVPQPDLSAIFPHLGNFPTQDLGFLG